MRRIKSFFGNQTFFGKNYKIFAIISSKSDIWQKMHVPCKNILDGQSLTAPCGRHRHKPASARRQRPARSRLSGQSRRPRPALRRPAGPQRPRGRQSAQARDSAKCAPGRRGSAPRERHAVQPVGALEHEHLSPVVHRAGPQYHVITALISEHLGVAHMAGQPGWIVLVVQ